jgi:tyrocidine synthetase-3
MTLKAFENQDYPFEDLVGKLVTKRELSRNPLFDVLFIFQNMEIPGIEIPGVKVKTYYYKRNTAMVDLTLVGEEVGHRLLFNIEYSTNLFKEETVTGIIEIYSKIIRYVSKHADAKIKDIAEENVPITDQVSSFREIEFNLG